MKPEKIRHALDTILISGTEVESKIDSILHVFSQYQGSGFIIGWLEISVREPDPNTYIDIRKTNGTVLFERLATDETLRRMRQDQSLWRPHFIE